MTVTRNNKYDKRENATSMKTSVVGRPATPGLQEAHRVNLASPAAAADLGPALHHMILGGADGLEARPVNLANPAEADGQEVLPVNLASQVPLLVDGGDGAQENLERVNQLKVAEDGLIHGAPANRASLVEEEDLEDGTVGESLVHGAQVNQESLVVGEDLGDILLLIHGAMVEDGIAGEVENLASLVVGEDLGAMVEDGMAGEVENLANPSLANPSLANPNLPRENGFGCLPLLQSPLLNQSQLTNQQTNL